MTGHVWRRDRSNEPAGRKAHWKDWACAVCGARISLATGDTPESHAASLRARGIPAASCKETILAKIHDS